MHCIDANSYVVDESYCRDSPYYGGGFPHFYWYYGGPSNLPIGRKAYDGSFTPNPGTNYVTPGGTSYSAGSGTVHGGFGSTSRGSAGSAGGHGGEGEGGGRAGGGT
jgi:hypothetical protein